MNALAEIKDVSDTAIWVAHYRALESDRPDALFQDPLAKLLTAERGEAIAASFSHIPHRMAWTVVMRTVLIDEFIQRGIAEGVDAVLNLGAGLDTRPYRMTLPASFRWVEADFPHVVEFKRAKLQPYTPHCDLQRVGVNFADDTARRKFLAEVLPDAKRVMVLTEGVVPYLTEAQVADLAADLLSQPRFAFWLAEYLSPEVYPYLRLFGATPMLASCPYRFFPADWQAFFMNNGWQQRERGYSMDVARRFGRMPPTSLWMRWFAPFMSQRKRDRVRPSTGFMLMTPAR